MSWESVILGFLENYAIQLVVAISALITIGLFRKGILRTLIRFFLWISNSTVTISRVVLYNSMSSAGYSETMHFISVLQNSTSKFTVNKVADDGETFLATKHGLTIRITITDLLVDSADSEHTGYKITGEMKDLDIPYRKGLESLSDIVPSYVRAADQAFGTKASNMVIKFIVPRDFSENAKSAINTTFRSKTSTITLNKNFLSVTETDVQRALKALKFQLSSVRLPRIGSS